MTAVAETAPHFLRDTFVPESKDYQEVTIEEEEAHKPPEFEKSMGDEEILYLPPLLSSLPQNIPRYNASDDKDAPLHTTTHLPSIDPVSLSLHRALHKFKPLTSFYASESYGESFNWASLKLPIDEEREWYCVAFRSRRKTGSDSARKSSPFAMPLL
jgi:hypothetical protein